jgi:hypothetical protein
MAVEELLLLRGLGLLEEDHAVTMRRPLLLEVGVRDIEALIVLKVSVEVVVLDVPWEKLNFVHKKIGEFFLESEVEETDWPLGVAGEVVDEVDLVVEF